MWVRSPRGRACAKQRGRLGSSLWVSDRAERTAADALRDAGTIEMRREPAPEEREPCTEDQAGVELGGAGHDALVQDAAGLVGKPLEEPLVDLVDGRPAVARLEGGELAVCQCLQDL